MQETARQFRDFIKLALDHLDGTGVALAFDRTFQFDLVDDAPFYMEVKGGVISVTEGDSGLDWKGRDWERVTCVHTSSRLLRDIITGERRVSDAFFDREIGFGPRRIADRHTSGESTVSWFYTLIRLASERAQELGRQRFLAEMIEG